MTRKVPPLSEILTDFKTCLLVAKTDLDTCRVLHYEHFTGTALNSMFVNKFEGMINDLWSLDEMITDLKKRGL